MDGGFPCTFPAQASVLRSSDDFTQSAEADSLAESNQLDRLRVLVRHRDSAEVERSSSTQPGTRDIAELTCAMCIFPPLSPSIVDIDFAAVPATDNCYSRYLADALVLVCHSRWLVDAMLELGDVHLCSASAQDHDIPTIEPL